MQTALTNILLQRAKKRFTIFAHMNFKCITLFSFIALFGLISFISCKKDNSEATCPAMAPATDVLRFRVVDKNTGVDLIQNGKLNVDSLIGYQPCYDTIPLIKKVSKYDIPGTQNLNGYCFGFTNMRTPAPGESECLTLLLKWSNKDIDTINWFYHIDETDPCKPQIMDRVLFNGGTIVQQYYDGAFQYYSLPK